jgi:hypothetical protein
LKIILDYIKRNENIIDNKIKSILGKDEIELTSNFLKILNSFNSTIFNLCHELKIEALLNTSNIESYLVTKGNVPQLLKLWINGLIDYFDFNTYCFYYFTLSLEERKIFNKKAKAKMGAEINKSMLRKREPWRFIQKIFIEDNVEADYYSATWKSIWFGKETIRICMDNKPSFSQQYNVEYSEEEFNFLHEYFSGRKMQELKIIAIGNCIKNIDGLEDLEVLIWKFKLNKFNEKSEGSKIRTLSTNRIPVNMLLRNQCIQLLNNFQLKELEPALVLENTFNPIRAESRLDVSLLYSIPLNKYDIAIIWESLELEKAKATHIFKCSRIEYENIFSEIEYYLSANLKVRSALNSKDNTAIDNQKRLRYLTKIEHDNFNFFKWENSLYQILPELKEILFSKEK